MPSSSAISSSLSLLRARRWCHWGFSSLVIAPVIRTLPGQGEPLRDQALELRMVRMLVEQMRANHAPHSQYERLGLPIEGKVTEAHLLVEQQWPQAQSALNRDWSIAPADSFAPILLRPISELAARPEIAARLSDGLGVQMAGPFMERFGHMSPWHLAVMLPSMTPARLREIENRARRA